MGYKIRELRKKLGLSQEDLSLKSGVPQSTISEIESGKRKNPSFQDMKRLANALEMTMEALEDHG